MLTAPKKKMKSVLSWSLLLGLLLCAILLLARARDLYQQHQKVHRMQLYLNQVGSLSQGIQHLETNSAFVAKQFSSMDAAMDQLAPLIRQRQKMA